jgi:predicted GIY-YIG superfamily endonuclease
MSGSVGCYPPSHERNRPTMKAKPAPDRIVPQLDPSPPEGYAPAEAPAEQKRSRFAPKESTFILTAPCQTCSALMRYNAIDRRFVCIRPGCESSYHLGEIERATLGTHCRRCGHIMALREEEDVFFCGNPRCPAQIGLRALINDLRVAAERKVGADGVPSRDRGTVYILHYHEPIGARRVRHYTGWAKYLPARILGHLAGKGSKLTRAFFRLGIHFDIGFSTPGTPAFERKIKRSRHAARLCSVCQRENNESPIDQIEW